MNNILIYIYLGINAIMLIIMAIKIYMSPCWQDYFWYPVFHSWFDWASASKVGKHVINLSATLIFFPAILAHFVISGLFIFIFAAAYSAIHYREK